MKRSLQELSNEQLLAIDDALNTMGWKFDSDGESVSNLVCSCGCDNIVVYGANGAEKIICSQCFNGCYSVVGGVTTEEGEYTIPDADVFDVTAVEQWLILPEGSVLGAIKQITGEK